MQDQPELLLADAQLAGVEVVSPQLERARLVEKSGEVDPDRGGESIGAIAG